MEVLSVMFDHTKSCGSQNHVLKIPVFLLQSKPNLDFLNIALLSENIGAIKNFIANRPAWFFYSEKMR